MSKLLLNLRNVPEDEIADICELLDTHGITHYQTQPSPWGISFGGIWLNEDEELPRAKALMADYHHKRGQRLRAERAAALQDGSADTFTTLLRRRPLFVVAVLVGMVVVASLVLLPFALLR